MRYNHYKAYVERVAGGLTQAQVAKRAGVSINTVRRFEWGTCSPRPKTLRRLAAALGVSPKDLIHPEDLF